MTNKYKIGIIGKGFVGRAVYNWFKNGEIKNKVEIFLYDKYENIGSPLEVNKAEIVFICVPTPYQRSRGYDDSAVIESIKLLEKSKIVVIKSTILPGSTEKFQKKFPNHKILFNPEFLKAKEANLDFLKPNRQIIGFTRKSKKLAKLILKLLPKASFTKIMPATEAEMVKYFGNTFLATKVIFANQIYDLCQKLKIDYNQVKEAAAADSRIGQSHLQIFFDGYRGYGGGCLPKDTKSLIDLAKKLKVEFPLLTTVDKINKKLSEKK